MTTWDPQQYQRFQKERAQPFFDLLSRIPDGEVTTAADLGCGPGTLTATLPERWPHASVWGVDNSSQMLATARAQPAQTRLHFVEANIAEWQPPRRLDRIISNAALHWVPEHQAVLQRLVSLLTPYGVLAVQMPNNHAEAPTGFCASQCSKSRGGRCWPARKSVFLCRPQTGTLIRSTVSGVPFRCGRPFIISSCPVRTRCWNG